MTTSLPSQPDPLRALATVETAERIMGKALQCIEDGDVAAAEALLHEAMRATTITTCSLVKSQTLSDSISQIACDHVTHHVARAERLVSARA